MHFVKSTAPTWNDIGANNVIFVGPPKFNLQVRDLPVVQGLVDEAQGIRNLRPRPGEPPSFEEGTFDPQNGSEETHALISRLPGLHRNGEILVVAGTATAGTLAATQYVTSEAYTRDLLRRIGMPNGKSLLTSKPASSPSSRAGLPLRFPALRTTCWNPTKPPTALHKFEWLGHSCAPQKLRPH
jgi:hypothetical protein